MHGEAQPDERASTGFIYTYTLQHTIIDRGESLLSQRDVRVSNRRKAYYRKETSEFQYGQSPNQDSGFHRV